MGGKSTSQSAVLKDSESKNTSYDLRSWQGLTEVLKDAKASLRSPEVYAEFRNLVLAYAKEGGDPALKEKIDTILATFKNQPKDADITSVVEEKPESKEKFALGGRRMQPRFIPTSRFTKSEATPIATESKPVQPRTNTSPLPPPPSQSNVTKEQVSTVVEKQTQEEEKEDQEKNIPESVRPVEQGIRTLEDYKNRITEIKRIVHEKVGNPAALIDTHNEAGKRYMVALLNALKATGGGGTTGADSAMHALEEAFVAITNDSGTKQNTTEIKRNESKTDASPVVQKTPDIVVENSKIKNEITTVEPQVSTKENDSVKFENKPKPSFPPLPDTTKTDTNEAASDGGNKTTSKPKQFEESIFADGVTHKSTSIADRIRELRQDSSDSKVTTSVHKENSTVGHSPREALLSALDDDDVTLPVSPDKKASSEEKKKDSLDTVDDDAVPAQTKHAHKGLGAQSLEEVKQEYNIDPKDVALRQSELFTPEITEALHELLHEWRVFSSSGLFGTGPGGSEHPLYIKLAPLSMGEVIAGRWEGTNPKTQKAIKEYVDAWRHEQGIAYTINETFEHYLRRVLQKILKRQKQNLGM